MLRFALQSPGIWLLLTAVPMEDMLLTSTKVPEQASPAALALQAGIEAGWRGDTERAADWLARALSAKEALSSLEQEELDRQLMYNKMTREARRSLLDEMGRVERAIEEGSLQQARDLLGRLAGNKYLTAGDRYRLRQLAGKLRS